MGWGRQPLETFGTEEAAGYHFESVFLAYLTNELRKTKTHVKDLMQVTAEAFEKWAYEVPEKLTKKTGSPVKRG